MLDSHHDAVLGFGGDRKLRRQCAPLRMQRMIAPDNELAWQSAKQPAAARADRRRLAVHRRIEEGERAAKILDDPLQAEADAKHRQIATKREIEKREIEG